jgi:GNAT superfamily N-acetyltransferase
VSEEALRQMDLPIALGDGLVLRRAETDRDVERIVELAERVFADEDEGGTIALWIRSLTGGNHPTTMRSDFCLVEDMSRRQFVSSMCLIPQTWAYEGVPFGVGRPELVATLPGYRRRGLIRAQFEALHADCAARGLPVQAITGIPYFYRQFGYEYALDLGGGLRGLYFDHIPKLEEAQTEPYAARRMTEDDLAEVMALHRAFAADKMIACRRDETYWRFALSEERHPSSETLYALVETDGGRLAGYFSVPTETWGPWLPINALVLADGASYLAVMPSLLRALRSLAEIEHAKPGKPVRQLSFSLGREHPAYDVLRAYECVEEPPYGWYLRVADLAAFIRRITPALEARLATSPVSGYSGELKIDFYYKSGLRLKLEDGSLAEAENTGPGVAKPHAGFPPLVFLKLLFGYRSLEELRHAFPDVWANREGRLLLGALFPKRLSWVAPLH